MLEIDDIVRELVAERIDPAGARAFAQMAIRRAESCRVKTSLPEHVLHAKSTALRDSLSAAAEAIESSSSQDVFLDAAYVAQIYAMRKAAPVVRDRPRWPGGPEGPDAKFPVPPIAALLAHLRAYISAIDVSTGKSARLPRGRPRDHERFYPAIYCGMAWVHAFGVKPGTGEGSPFVKAFGIVLPLFMDDPPVNVHSHVQNAFRGVDIVRLAASEARAVNSPKIPV